MPSWCSQVTVSCHLEMAYTQASLYPVTHPHGLWDDSDGGDRSPRYIVLASETSPFTSQPTNCLQSRGNHLGNLSWGTVPHFPHPAVEKNPSDSLRFAKGLSTCPRTTGSHRDALQLCLQTTKAWRKWSLSCPPPHPLSTPPTHCFGERSHFCPEL